MKPLPAASLITVLLSLRAKAGVIHTDVTNNITKRAGRDCGVFTMYCGGVPRADGQRRPALGACNNACYFINIHHGGEYTAVWRSDIKQDKNRHHSGCRISDSSPSVKDGSVCNAMPISQQFGDFGKESATCDEFPMADMVQDDFDPNRVPRNTLRCIPRSENSAAGAQYLAFTDGTGSGLKGRTCEGKLQDDDYFKVEFDYDNVQDPNDIPYCKMGDNNPIDGLDNLEFWMTQMKTGEKGGDGSNHFPYNFDLDNHYADALSKKEVNQCYVALTRKTDATYNVEWFDNSGNSLAHDSKQLPNKGDCLSTAAHGDLSRGGRLDVCATDAVGDSGKGSDVQFQYLGYENFASSWLSNSVGWDERFSKNYDNVRETGGYCSVPDIGNGEQKIACYFPCVEYAPSG